MTDKNVTSDEFRKKRKKVHKRRKVVRMTAYILIGSLLGAYLIYQFVQAYYSPVTTETAHMYTAYDSVEAEIFVVRSETRVSNSEGGVMVNAVASGDKVENGGIISYIFDTQEDADTYRRGKEIEEEINYLNGLRTLSTGVYMASPETIDKNILNSMYETLDTISSGRLDGLENSVSEFKDLINKRFIFTEKLTNIEQKIRELTTELAALTPYSELECSELKAPESGVFVNTYDGYEKVFDYNNIESVTPEDFDVMLSSEPDNVGHNCIGKIVDKFNWYILCTVDSKYCGELENGDEVTIVLPAVDDNKLETDVVAMNKSGDRVTIVMKCSIQNSELASLRRETAQIRLKTYDGIRVDSEAVRIDESGQTGVYALVGNVVKFRKADIIYSTDEYSIVQYVDTTYIVNSDYIHLYDEIIVKGKELYDGKVI